MANQTSTSNMSYEPLNYDFLTDEQFALFVRKFKMFMRKNNFVETTSPRKPMLEKKVLEHEDFSNLCCNCRKPKHFKF